MARPETVEGPAFFLISNRRAVSESTGHIILYERTLTPIFTERNREKRL
jgi:hypothetical protein